MIRFKELSGNLTTYFINELISLSSSQRQYKLLINCNGCEDHCGSSRCGVLGDPRIISLTSGAIDMKEIEIWQRL